MPTVSEKRQQQTQVNGEKGAAAVCGGEYEPRLILRLRFFVCAQQQQIFQLSSVPDSNESSSSNWCWQLEQATTSYIHNKNSAKTQNGGKQISGSIKTQKPRNRIPKLYKYYRLGVCEVTHWSQGQRKPQSQILLTCTAHLLLTWISSNTGQTDWTRTHWEAAASARCWMEPCRGTGRYIQGILV